MRRAVVVLIAVTSTLLSVLLAVAVNVATGGTLPKPLDTVSWLAWPAVGVLAVVTILLTVWQQRLADPTTPGEGQEEVAAAPVVVPAQRRSVPAELPAPPTVFAGRADDLTAVEGLIAGGCRVVAVVGPPGAGKSSLALRIAHDRRPEFPDGQLFAVLRGAQADPVAPETVLIRFLGALGVPEEERRGDVEELAARLRSALAERKVLILLDDARDAAQVRPLLPGGAGCLVLVTSRRQMTELPGAGQRVLGGLDEDSGRALLADAVGDGRVADDPAGAARIVQLCGGLPLAVRIVGARLRARPAWTPSHLADRLANARRRLDELRLGDVAVRSSFEASYMELEVADRLVFRRVGSHPGLVFGVGAAAALAGVEEAVVGPALERLVDVNLVESPEPERYRMHDLLRLFATERLADEEDRAEQRACLARLLDWCVAHAHAGDWLARERDNVIAIVHRAVEAGEHERAWALVQAVDPLLAPVGDHPDLLALWTDAAAAAAALGDDARRAEALRWVATCYTNAGEVTRALAPAGEAVAIAERLDDRRAQAHGLSAYGEALRDLYRFDEAVPALERALELFAELGDVDEEVSARGALGAMYNMIWRPDLAVAVMEWALPLLPEAQEHRDAWILSTLSSAYNMTGQREKAVELNAKALEAAQRIGDKYAYGFALQGRGWIAYDSGRYDDALHDMRASFTTLAAIRHGTGVGLAYDGIGVVSSAAGRHDEAIEALASAATQFERLGDRARSGRSRLYRAEALARAGRHEEARQEWARGERLIGNTEVPEAPRARQRLRELLDGQPSVPPT